MTKVVTLVRLDPKLKTSLEQWKFTQESCIRIGRAADNDVVIVDPLVSRYHVELHESDSSTPGQSWRLVSKGTNGTFLNGLLINQAVLLPGAMIELARGGPLLQFQVTSQKTTPPIRPNCTHAGNPPHHLFCIHCGFPIKVERTVRQYQVLQTLGQGGMGTTLLAWDPEQNPIQSPTQGLGQITPPNLAVIKEMNTDMAQIAKAQELFEREARMLKALNHQGIPQFYDFFVEQGKKYLVMEMIHGQDLEKLIHQRGPVAPIQAVEWMLQTCEVLDYLHTQTPPIVHRDIKPANLLLHRRDRRIIVIDFGAVKEIGTPPGTRIGAEGYSAPEQDRGQPLTQSDLYAIGTTLIFLVTGESPLNFYSKQAQSYGFNLDNVPTMTPELKKVISKATTYRVRDRLQTVKELVEVLVQCQK
ncbi:MAG: protein kinase domain-containing protein [Microcoleaceae cyanobacterium]